MKSFKVEHKVKMPEATWHIWPFPQMKPGDSFLVPTSMRIHSSVVAGPRHYWQKKLGRKFSIRKVKGGVRVWRVK